MTLSRSPDGFRPDARNRPKLGLLLVLSVQTRSWPPGF